MTLTMMIGGHMNDRLEACGAIASGKTTLAHAFSRCGFAVEMEDFSKIAMLDDFYSDPLSVSFETELSFTLQHYYQIKKTLKNCEYTVCDFSSVDDYAFALSILNEREMEIYDQVFGYIIERIGRPQKLIRLLASTDELISRIQKRGRENEQSISKLSLLKFEESLSTAIERYYSDVPLVKVQTEQHTPSDYNKAFLLNL